MSEKQPSSRRTRKIAAVAAGVLVVGVGATYTLASWTDSEWVWGGSKDGVPIIGTSSFEVLQNVSKPFDNSASWLNKEVESDPGVLQFSLEPVNLTPGDAVYAPVALKTSAVSEQASVLLQAGKASTVTNATHDAGLAAAVKVSVYTIAGTTAPACAESDDLASWGTPLYSKQALTHGLQDIPANRQTLSKEAGSIQHYCFVVELEDTTANQTAPALQGKRISPAWEFKSTS